MVTVREIDKALRESEITKYKTPEWYAAIRPSIHAIAFVHGHQNGLVVNSKNFLAWVYTARKEIIFSQSFVQAEVGHILKNRPGYSFHNEFDIVALDYTVQFFKACKGLQKLRQSIDKLVPGKLGELEFLTRFGVIPELFEVRPLGTLTMAELIMIQPYLFFGWMGWKE